MDLFDELPCSLFGEEKSSGIDSQEEIGKPFLETTLTAGDFL